MISLSYKEICAILALFGTLAIMLFAIGFSERGNALGLVPGLDGNFYRTGDTGRVAISDAKSRLNAPEDTLTTLYSLCASGNCIDGAFPPAAMMRSADNSSYAGSSPAGTLVSPQPRH